MSRGFLFSFGNWGPSFWNVLHTVSFTYPEAPSADTRERMRLFLLMMANALPCSLCGVHFYRHIQEKLDARALASRDALSRWMVAFHNDVNTRTGKPLAQYEDVAHFYLRDGTPGTPLSLVRWRTASAVLGVVVLLMLGAIVSLVLARNKR